MDSFFCSQNESNSIAKNPNARIGQALNWVTEVDKLVTVLKTPAETKPASRLIQITDDDNKGNGNSRLNLKVQNRPSDTMTIPKLS